MCESRRIELRFLCGAAISVAILCVPAFAGHRQTRRSSSKRSPPKARICFDPTLKCPTTGNFQAYDLLFRLPQNAVIYDTDAFYAIILKRVRVAASDCDKFIAEDERLRAQKLFPHRKVFASRRCAEAGDVGYTNANNSTPFADLKSEFMAVYAGTTPSEAAQMLAAVKATRQFPGAAIRRLRAAFNGT